MSLWSLFRRRTSPPLSKTAAVVGLRGRYDAAVTDEDNRRHWANADSLSARQANSASVRQTLRNRARYEVANNCYANGMVKTLANDVIGTGPRLQIQTGDSQADTRLEAAFRRWSWAIRLAEKLRTLRIAKAVEGEGIALMVTNERVPGPIKLDLRLIEAEQMTTPTLALGLVNNPRLVDGIHFDESGNPVKYDILPYHPGDVASLQQPVSYDADHVLHWFSADRPGQARGIPDITPALPLFAIRRRYVLATCLSAEAAANIAGILYTDLAPEDPSTADVEPWTAIETEKNGLLTLPNTWKLAQLKAEHPTTTLEMYDRAIIREIARCLNMPLIVALGDSTDANYASGRLDWQTYFKAISVERSDIERIILAPLLRAWLDEATLVPGLIPSGIPPFAEWSVDWMWDGREHVDPVKEATAQEIRLRNGTTSPQIEASREGRDWEQIDLQNARAYGMSLEQWRRIRFHATFRTTSDPLTEDEVTDE